MTPDTARAQLAQRLRDVAAGDRVALRDVYAMTSAKLFGVILRILGDREEAEDVLQDVFVTIWNRADRFDPARASPITWLASIARNRAIDRLRAGANRARSVPVEEIGDLADDNPDALAALQSGDEARRLARCLDTLEARAREAILAAFYGGRTYEDLAAASGTPLGTMKSLIRRALLRLRACLEP